MNEEIKKEKKKWSLNKKLFLFGILPLFVVLVSALTYYAVFSATITFTQPIVTSGLDSIVILPIGTFSALGNPITISNIGNTERTVVISHNNVNPAVEVSYVGQLVLTKKSLTDWSYDLSNTKTITYTLVGNTFKFSGVPDNHSLVYYKDDIGYVYTGNVVTNITMNLPVIDDENAINNSDLDYCNNGFNTGATQCVGAKLWLVPTNAISVGNIINWGRANEFYFETELIQFNKEGNLVISPHSSITFRPQFEVDKYAINWTGTIKTTIA